MTPIEYCQLFLDDTTLEITVEMMKQLTALFPDPSYELDPSEMCEILVRTK